MKIIYLVIRYNNYGGFIVDNAFESKADAEKRCKDLHYKDTDILSVQYFEEGGKQ